MKKLIVFLALSLFLQASTLFAKDICVESNFLGSLIFKNVKIDKRPFVGKWFHGVAGCNGQLSAPVIGIADMQNTTVRIGVTAYMVGCGDSSSFVFTMLGDKDFNATGNIDRGSNGIGNTDGFDTWTSVDCNQVP